MAKRTPTNPIIDYITFEVVGKAKSKKVIAAYRDDKFEIIANEKAKLFCIENHGLNKAETELVIKEVQRSFPEYQRV